NFHTFPRQRACRLEANPFAPASHERRFIGKSEFHRSSSFSKACLARELKHASCDADWVGHAGESVGRNPTFHGKCPATFPSFNCQPTMPCMSRGTALRTIGSRI